MVGVGSRGALAPIVHGRVSRYCRAHARWPVLAVPPPPLAHEAPHGALARAFWHRTLTTDQISPGKAPSSRLAAAAPFCRAGQA